jgi:hypothetical protein
MSRDVTLRLDEFGREAFDRFMTRRGRSAASAVTTASLYYLADRDSGRAGWRVPRFDEGNGARAATVTVTLDDATWTALAEEADRQGVTGEAVAVHALMYFLADLESGYLAGRIEEALEEPE